MQKTEQISNALSGIIADGEKFSITATKGVIEVRPISDKDALKILNPDLHGRLLSYEQRLMGSGNEVWFFLLGALLVDILISTNLTSGFGLDLSKLQTWWVYIGSFAIAMTLNTFRLNSRVKRQFRRLAPSIREEISKANISEGELLSLLSNDSGLFNIKSRLMLDKNENGA